MTPPTTGRPRPGCRPRRSTSHGALRDGGRERAGRRRDRLLETERYTAKSLRRWREAHAEYVPSRGARQAPIRQTGLAEEIDALADKVDRAIRAGARPGAEGGPRRYLSALRAADVHAFVRSRRKFAWAVAMLETHSMSLDPGPRSRESETALRVDS